MIPGGLRGTLTSRALAVLATRGVGIGIAFVVHILLARLMGSAGYGVFIYMVAWLNLSAMIGRMGLDQAMIRFVPSTLALNDLALLHGLFRRSQLLVLVAGSLVAVLSAALLQSVVPEMVRDLEGYFPWIFVMVPLLALADLWRGVLRGLKRAAAAEFLDNGLRPVVLALVAGGSWLLVRTLPPGPVVAAMAVFALLSVVAARRLARPALPPLPAQTRYETQKWLDVGMWILFTASMQMILTQGDLLMVGHFLGSDAAGVYGAAGRLAALAQLGLVATNSVAAPVIAEFHANRQHEGLRNVLALAAVATFAFSLLMLATLGTWSGEVLSLFGPTFELGGEALRILLAGQAVAALFVPAGLSLAVTGHHRMVGLVSLASALANVALNSLLIPRYGLAGAAWATSLALVASRATMAYQARRVLGVPATLRWPRSFSLRELPSKPLAEPEHDRDGPV